MAFSKARRLSDFIAADGTIPTGKFASSSITSSHLVDGTIAHADLHTDMDLTGKTVLVANASTGDSDTTAANTAFVQQEIAALVDSSPGTLNTLNELAAALGDDANFSTTVTNSIATKLPLAGGTMTGLLTAGAKLKITDLGNATVAALQLGNSGLGISSPSTDQMNFITADTTRMVIDSSGNITGMTSGTAMKAPLLQATNGNVATYTGTTPTLHSPASGTLAFSMSGGERMRITSTGEIVTGGLTSSTGQLHLYKADATGGKLVLQSQVSADATAKISMMSRLADNTNKTAYIEAYRGNISFGGESGYGKVGINVEKNGNSAPQKTFHVEHAAGASEGILISGASDTTGHTAGILLRAEGGEADSDLRAKGAIFFERTAVYGLGKLHLANNIGSDNTSATLSDARLTISGSNVGVGIVNPAFRFHTYHPTTNVVARFESGDNQVWIDLHDDGSGNYGALLGHDTDNNILFRVANADVDDKLILSPSGNLTIAGRLELIDGNNYIVADQSTATSMKFYLNNTVAGEWARTGSGGSIRPNQYSSSDTAANLPALASYDDHDTGVFFPEADKVGFAAGGNNIFTVKNTGQIEARGEVTGTRIVASVQDMFNMGAEKSEHPMITGTGRTYVDGGSSNYAGYQYGSENFFPPVFIPYSPNQVYRVSASLYQLTGSTASGGASSRHYFGLAGYDENFNFLQTDGIGTYQYILGSNFTLNTGSTQEMDVTMKGWQGSGATDGNKMDQGTVYIRPLALINYQSAGATAVLTGFNIMPAGTVADNDSNAGTNY